MTLTVALDAWQNGQLKSLRERDPAIRLVDADLAAGWKLTGYRFTKPEALIRPFQDVEIVLKLTNRQGQSREQRATYQVTLDPPAVLRSDD